MRLPAVIVRPYVARAALLWLLARVTLLVLLVLAMEASGASGAVALGWSPAAALGVVPLCVLLGHVELARSGDRFLLGNLGIGPRQQSVFFALVALGAEVVLGVAVLAAR